MLGYTEAIKASNARCQVVIKLLVAIGFAVFFTLPAHGQQTFVMGPIHGNIGAQAGVQYTDNLNNSPSKQSAFSILGGPTFDGGITLPVHFGSSLGDEMTLNAGVSYQEQYYLTTNYVTQSFSSPLSVNLMIPMRFGEWKATVGDTFRYENVDLDSAVIANQARVAEYDNTASINLDRNFGKTDLGLGAERIDKISSAPSQSETDYQFSVTPAYILRENYRLFWANTYGMSFPDDYTRQNTESYSSEIGVSGQITPYFNGSIQAGYALTHLDEKVAHLPGGTTTNLPAQWSGGPSASMTGSYTHPLNPNTTYSFSAYYSPGVTALLTSSSAQSVLGVTLSIAHRLTKNLTLAPTAQWTHIESIGGIISNEKDDIFSTGMTLTRQFSRHLSAYIEYKYVNRTSNLPDSTYDVTQITIQANYIF